MHNVPIIEELVIRTGLEIEPVILSVRGLIGSIGQTAGSIWFK
jgi:hypothetical protein